jgi:hypothetical protein
MKKSIENKKKKNEKQCVRKEYITPRLILVGKPEFVGFATASGD